VLRLIDNAHAFNGNGIGNGNGKCEFIWRNCHEVSNALSMLVAREKPGSQALSLIVLICVEVVRQGVPGHGALHSECSAANFKRFNISKCLLHRMKERCWVHAIFAVAELLDSAANPY